MNTYSQWTEVQGYPVQPGQSLQNVLQKFNELNQIVEQSKADPNFPYNELKQHLNSLQAILNKGSGSGGGDGRNRRLPSFNYGDHQQWTQNLP